MLQTFLRKKLLLTGGDPERETLNIILTKDGANYLQDETGDYWRSYVFIDDATCFDLVEKPEIFTTARLHSDISAAAGRLSGSNPA